MHARARDGVALGAGNFRAVEYDRALTRRHHAHETLQRRALSRAVAAEQRHHFVALDVQCDVEEDVAVPVISIETSDLEQRHSAANTPCTPPR